MPLSHNQGLKGYLEPRVFIFLCLGVFQPLIHTLHAAAVELVLLAWV